jgi:hypothetical protein
VQVLSENYIRCFICSCSPPFLLAALKWELVMAWVSLPADFLDWYRTTLYYPRRRANSILPTESSRNVLLLPDCRIGIVY